ncbi:MAG: cell division protein FtsB [Pasteurellales bacterium]|nr:MAG: cell division protein FtsB [Pasteurellales bacterium]
MRGLTFFLILLLAIFQFRFWFGQNGYIDYKNTQIEVVQLEKERQQLVNRNNKISAEIDDLTNAFDALEERARLRYEQIKKDEVFYRIIHKD